MSSRIGQQRAWQLMARAGPQQQASPGGNLAVSSSRLHPALGLHTTPGHGHPSSCEHLPGCSATPSCPAPTHTLSITTHRIPGHPCTVGLSTTHTQMTLLGSCGRTVAVTRINPGIRGWERSHQPAPAPRTALPVTATSSSKGTGHRGGTCWGWRVGGLRLTPARAAQAAGRRAARFHLVPSVPCPLCPNSPWDP